MRNYLKVIAGSTSAVCILCSIYYWARSQTNARWRRRSMSLPTSSSLSPRIFTDFSLATFTTDKDHEPNSGQRPVAKEQPAVSLVVHDEPSEQLLLNADGSQTSVAFPPVDVPNSPESAQVAGYSLPPPSSPSILSRGFTVVSAYLHRFTRSAASRDSQLSKNPPDRSSTSAFPANSSVAHCLSPAELTELSQALHQLAEQAGISLRQGQTSISREKLRLPHSTPSKQKSVYGFMEALVSYTKSDRFIELFYASATCQPLLIRLCEWAVHLIPNDMTPMVDANGALVSADLVSGDEADNGQEGDTKAASETVEEVTSSMQTHYPFHLLLANLLANLSRKKHVLFTSDCITSLLATWTQSPSLHLLLLAEKIQHNMAVLQRNCESTTGNVGLARPIYYPSVYQLNARKQCNTSVSTAMENSPEDYNVDIVFVHGMRGSVFYTWRQDDSHLTTSAARQATVTKCWPRDWLSADFPNARIIGVDSSLSPFIWNSACPVDNSKRSLHIKAGDLLHQLTAAGIGQRPIIWITHSAGGVLVKELLRVPALQLTMCDSNVSLVSEADLPFLHHVTSANWMSDQHPDNLPRSASLSEIHVPYKGGMQRDNQPGTSSPCSASSVLAGDSQSLGLPEHTQGIVFISVPHRGNRSLSALYFRPMRWTLTPEAIQLERDNNYLLGLHSWFNVWAARCNLPILTLTETVPTTINRFYSVLLVPEDLRDQEMGKVVRISSDHLYISKPKTPNDPVYTNIVEFIKSVLSSGVFQHPGDENS